MPTSNNLPISCVPMKVIKMEKIYGDFYLIINQGPSFTLYDIYTYEYIFCADMKLRYYVPNKEMDVIGLGTDQGEIVSHYNSIMNNLYQTRDQELNC